MFPHPVILLALATLGTPAAAQTGAQTTAAASPDGMRWAGPVPTLQLGGGDFTLRPTLRLDADAGSFLGQDEPGGYRSGVNLRRGRLGVSGTVLRDFSYVLTWEFGGSSPNDYNNFYEGQVAYTGLPGTTLRIGAFTPQHMPDYAIASFDLPFLERAAISNIVAALASGDTRLAAGAEGNGALGNEGARWNASGYVTGGVGSTPHDERQRGLAGRAVVLAVDRPGLQFQLGADAAAQFHPGTSPGPESIRLRDYPEIRVDSRRFLDSGALRAGSAWAAGPELSARLGPVYLEAAWQQVRVDTATAGDARFQGWYVQGMVPVLGEPRQRVNATGTWRRPTAKDWPGAVELAARYSTVDLRDAGQGSRQSVATFGVNWYPTERLRLAAQYENGTTALIGRNRDFQVIGLRAAFNL